MNCTATFCTELQQMIFTYLFIVLCFGISFIFYLIRRTTTAIAGTKHTAQSGCPNSNAKLCYSKNQNNGCDCHLRLVCEVVVTIIPIVVSCNGNAVTNDSYSTKHSRSDGETHIDSSLA